MARNRNFSRREKRKAPATVPAVPDRGRLTMPRKTNQAAAKTVAARDVLSGQAQSSPQGPQAGSGNKGAQDLTRLPYVQRALVKVQGVSLEQIVYVAGRAPKTALFVRVNPVRKSQQTMRVAHLW